VSRSVSDEVLRDAVKKIFNPYGIDAPPAQTAPLLVHRGESDASVVSKRFLLNCPWFQVYNVVEEVLGQLEFYERELSTDPAEERRAGPLQRKLNDYFVYAGIGWQLVDGKVVARGDEAFEDTVNTAVTVLKEDAKPTAAGHLRFAIAALSARPKPNTSGAVAHATSGVECVLGEITGRATTLGKYLDKNPALFHPALKKGLDGVYGYASDEGARHGKEGTEPAREEAEFAVAVCAAVCTLLTRKHPNGS
jgi:AbiJ N-terminal domain 4